MNIKKNNGYSYYERLIARNVKFRQSSALHSTDFAPYFKAVTEKNKEKTKILDFILMIITKSYRAVDSKTVINLTWIKIHCVQQ